MTDGEFEQLNAKLQRLLRGRRKIQADLLARLASCKDCERSDPEFYMLPRKLGLQAVPSGRGCFCLACLSKRLGGPLAFDDFSQPPVTRGGDAVKVPRGGGN